MKKVFLVSGVLMSSLLLTGCIKMDIDHTISSNGGSDVKIAADFSALNAMTKGMKNSLSGSLSNTGSSQDDGKLCKTASGSTSGANNIYLKNYTCTAIDADHAVMTASVDTVAMNGFISKNGVFIYDLKKIEKIVDGEKKISTVSAAQTSSSKDPSDSFANNPKAYGFEYTYRVTMPGEIIRTDIGTISGSTLTVDYFALAKLSQAYVIAKAPGASPTDADIADTLATIKSFVPVGSVALAPAQEAVVQKFIQNAEKKWVLAKSKLLDQLIAIQGKIGKEKAEVYNRLVYLLKNGGTNATSVIKNTKKNVPKMRQSVEDLRSADEDRVFALRRLLSEIDLYHFNNKKYPDNLDQLNGTFFKVPQDPKQGKNINGCEFWYKYTLVQTTRGGTVPVVSNCMESAEMQEEAQNDGGVDPLRYERWQKWVRLSK